MSSSDISSALRQLVAGEFDVPPRLTRSPGDRAEGRGALTRSLTAAVPSARTKGRREAGAKRARRRLRQQLRRRAMLKAGAVPMLVLVGLAVLVPGLWGAAVLLGEPVWLADRSDAGRMAVVMLPCWPIAMFMFGGAAMYWHQIRSARRALTSRMLRG